MKDFMIDDYQFELARGGVLTASFLIVALIKDRLVPMLGKAEELGLSALVEVHDERNESGLGGRRQAYRRQQQRSKDA